MSGDYVPPRVTYPDIMATIRAIQDVPPSVASVLVAPGVWDRLKEAVPICRGSSLETFGIKIYLCEWLPPGVIVPLDQHGRPMPKPGDEAKP